MRHPHALSRIEVHRSRSVIFSHAGFEFRDEFVPNSSVVDCTDGAHGDIASSNLSGCWAGCDKARSEDERWLGTNGSHDVTA